jgi:putative DNA primase/helicase
VVEALCEDKTKRWATHNHGQPISARQLANLLKPYKIEPQLIRAGKDDVHRGFYRADFTDAWQRYLDGKNAQTY